eukprot:5378189-Amphidinium_carterae.1
MVTMIAVSSNRLNGKSRAIHSIISKGKGTLKCTALAGGHRSGQSLTPLTCAARSKQQCRGLSKAT